jgi:hypothetical protein
MQHLRYTSGERCKMVSYPCEDCEVPDEICDPHEDCVADVWHSALEVNQRLNLGIYVVQATPDDEVKIGKGLKVKPIATLKNEYGDVSHIIKEDHCYVLINKICRGGPFKRSYYWFPEVVDALKHLNS